MVDDVESIQDCEHWRSQVIREVTRKISEIQNAGLGEHRIRDLNDEINKLLREKRRWEERIRNLGGPDYKASSTRIVDAFGAELPGEGGYKYFGAAKELPGVRELFERETAPKAPRKTRGQLYRHITPDYYGWRDEEDQNVLLVEQAKEIELQREAVRSWRERGPAGPATTTATTSSAESPEMAKLPSETTQPSEFRAYVPLPSTQDIQELLLQKKKQALMDKYVSAQQQRIDQEAGSLSGHAPGGGRREGGVDEG